MTTEDKIQILWHLSNEYSSNIMFDVDPPYDTRLILPVLILRDSAYLPFMYKGLKIMPRHVG